MLLICAHMRCISPPWIRILKVGPVWYTLALIIHKVFKGYTQYFWYRLNYNLGGWNIRLVCLGKWWLRSIICKPSVFACKWDKEMIFRLAEGSQQSDDRAMYWGNRKGAEYSTEITFIGMSCAILKTIHVQI